MHIVRCLKSAIFALLACCGHLAHSEEPKPVELVPLSSIKIDPEAVGDDYELDTEFIIDDFSQLKKLPRAQRTAAEGLKKELVRIGVVSTAEYSIVRTTTFPLNTVVMRVYIFESEEKRKRWCDKKYGYDGWEKDYKSAESDPEGMTILDSKESSKRIIHFGRVWITTHQLQNGDEHLKVAESVIDQLKVAREDAKDVDQSDERAHQPK